MLTSLWCCAVLLYRCELKSYSLTNTTRIKSKQKFKCLWKWSELFLNRQQKCQTRNEIKVKPIMSVTYSQVVFGYRLCYSYSCLVVPLLLTRVVDTGLDDIIHGEAAGGGLASQLAVDLLAQHLQQITHAGQTLLSLPGNLRDPERSNHSIFVACIFTKPWIMSRWN